MNIEKLFKPLWHFKLIRGTIYWFGIQVISSFICYICFLISPTAAAITLFPPSFIADCEVKLFARCSLAFACYLLVFACCSLVFAYCLLLFACSSLLFARCSLLFARCLLPFAYCSLLPSRCSLLFACCS